MGSRVSSESELERGKVGVWEQSRAEQSRAEQSRAEQRGWSGVVMCEKNGQRGERERVKVQLCLEYRVPG